MGATGAGSPTKWAPPSVVRTIEVHTGLLQGATPSSQYWSADMAVNESGSKPEGTGPPAGCEPLTPLGGTAFVVGTGFVVGTEVEEEVGGTVVGVAAVAVLAEGPELVEEPLGSALVVGPTVVETAGAVVVGAALLPPLLVPQPAASSPAASSPAAKVPAAKVSFGSNAAGQQTNFLVLTALSTLGHKEGFLGGPATAPQSAPGKLLYRFNH
jgi:hypothetical protein